MPLDAHALPVVSNAARSLANRATRRSVIGFALAVVPTPGAAVIAAMAFSALAVRRRR